jgi:hypothetical protein
VGPLLSRLHVALLSRAGLGQKPDSARQRSSAVQLASQRSRVDEVNELSLPVDLHNWYELAELFFELSIAVYPNLFEFEVKLIEDGG